ncbi:MAG: RND transporter, partial [Brachymonas sp.]|nr:RND transporter [Brachymonas sp.]
MPLRLTALVANLALATLGLSACVSMEPAYKQPDLPVPNRYAEAAAAQSGAQAGMLAWEDFSADAQLNALVRQALANNRDLRAAVLRVEEARAAYGIQR